MNDERIYARTLRLTSFMGMALEVKAGWLVADGLPFTEDEAADLHLANALLEVEHYVECRRIRRQRVAIERLLASVPPGGTYEEVLSLPRDQRWAAARDLVTLGWIGAPPGE